MLRMPGRKSREYARYSPLLLFIFVFLYPVAAIRRWSVGVQEQEIPEGAFYDTEIPDDQE